MCSAVISLSSSILRVLLPAALLLWSNSLSSLRSEYKERSVAPAISNISPLKTGQCHESGGESPPSSSPRKLVISTEGGGNMIPSRTCIQLPLSFVLRRSWATPASGKCAVTVMLLPCMQT